MISSNARDNPICDNLMINGTSVEQVELFTYLGTVVDSKLNFKSYTEAVVKKAHKNLFIMKKTVFPQGGQTNHYKVLPYFH